MEEETEKLLYEWTAPVMHTRLHTPGSPYNPGQLCVCVTAPFFPNRVHLVEFEEFSESDRAYLRAAYACDYNRFLVTCTNSRDLRSAARYQRTILLLTPEDYLAVGMEPPAEEMEEV